MASGLPFSVTANTADRENVLTYAACILNAIRDVPAEHRMDAVATSVKAWLELDDPGDVGCVAADQWRY